MTSDLLPCPFCGGKGAIQREDGMFMAHCAETNCIGHHYQQDEQPGWNHEKRTKDAAITAWNTRAKADQIMAVEGEAVAALAALKAEVVEVVGPFANAWRECEAKTPNHMPRQQDLARFVMSTDFRAARDLLAKLKEN